MLVETDLLRRRGVARVCSLGTQERSTVRPLTGTDDIKIHIKGDRCAHTSREGDRSAHGLKSEFRKGDRFTHCFSNGCEKGTGMRTIVKPFHPKGTGLHIAHMI